MIRITHSTVSLRTNQPLDGKQRAEATGTGKRKWPAIRKRLKVTHEAWRLIKFSARSRYIERSHVSGMKSTR